MTRASAAPRRCSSTIGASTALPIKVVRIFNTYGPRTHPNDGRVVSSFIVQALRNQDITIFGDGEQTRSFCYVDDLIRGLIAMMETGPEVIGPDQSRQSYRVHHSRARRADPRVDRLRSKIVHRPLPQDDPQQRRPDISEAKGCLAGAPPLAREGLTKTIPYFETAGRPEAIVSARRIALYVIGACSFSSPGGAGYVGAHACKALASAGYTPVVFDNLSTGHESFVRWGPFVPGRHQRYATLRDAIRAHQVEAVLHFAASAYVGESVADPQKYYENNVGGTLSLLRAMLEAGCRSARVLQLLRHLWRAERNSHCARDAANSRSTPMAPPKRWSSASFATMHAPTRFSAIALRYFNASGADPEGTRRAARSRDPSHPKGDDGDPGSHP